MFKLNPVAYAIIFGFVRIGAAAFGTWMLNHGIWDHDERATWEPQVIAGGMMLIAAFAGSAWSKVRHFAIFNAALALPEGSTRDAAKALYEADIAPPASLPSNVAPKLPLPINVASPQPPQPPAA